MKYLKKAFENFKGKKEFEEYLENHFEDLFDNYKMMTWEIVPENKKILSTNILLSISYPDDDTEQSIKNFYKFSKFISDISELIKNLKNDPNIIVCRVNIGSIDTNNEISIRINVRENV